MASSSGGGSTSSISSSSGTTSLAVAGSSSGSSSSGGGGGGGGGRSVKRPLYTWLECRPTGAEPSKRYGHTAVVYSGCLYVFGGFDRSSTLNDMHRFSFDSQRWTRMEVGGVLPSPRFYHSAVVHDAKMWVFGGHSGHGGKHYSDIHCYHFDINEWEEVVCDGEPQQGRRSHTAVVYHSLKDTEDGGVATYMYIFGGSTSLNGYSNDFYRFNFARRHWEVVNGREDVPSLKNHAAVVFRKRMYVFGGRSQVGFVNDLNFYDFERKEWGVVQCSALESPHARGSHTCVVSGGDLLVYGGVDLQQSYGDMWKISLDKLEMMNEIEWLKLKCYGEGPGVRYNHTADAAHNRMCIFGGYSDEESRKSFKNDIFFMDLDPISVPAPTLVADMRSILQDSEYSDIKFVFDDGSTLAAHKAILCARSEHFRNMLRSQMKEARTGIVEISEVPREIFAVLLDFLYTDTLDLEEHPHYAASLLPLAEQYSLPRLKALTTDLIRDHISSSNVVDILLSAAMHRAEGLKQLCLEFIVDNVVDVRERGCFALLKDNPEVLFAVMVGIATNSRTLAD